MHSHDRGVNDDLGSNTSSVQGFLHPCGYINGRSNAGEEIKYIGDVHGNIGNAKALNRFYSMETRHVRMCQLILCLDALCNFLSHSRSERSRLIQLGFISIRQIEELGALDELRA